MIKKNNKIFENLIWKFGERISAQIVTFVVSIVLARLLSPQDYGSIAVVMIFITLANVFVTSGFGTALIQKRNTDNIDFSSVFYFNIIFSIFIYVILYMVSPNISKFYNIEILTPVIRVLGIRIIIAAINSVQQAYVSKNMMFKKFFLSTIFGTILSGVVGIYMAYSGYGVWALVGQYLTNTTIDTIILWFTVKWRPELVFSIKRMRILFKYGWKILCSALLDTGYSQLSGLIIGKMYTPENLAFYDRGQQYPSLIVNNINASIGSVLFPVMSKHQEDRAMIKNITRRAIKVSSYIMWPMMIGLAVVSEPLIRIMLTDKWLPCVPFLQIACFTFGFWPIHTSNLEAIKAIGKSDIFLRVEIAKKIVGLIILLISVKHGVMAIALSGIVMTLASTVINAYPNSKLLGYNYKEQMSDIIPSFILSIAMGWIILKIGTLIGNDILKIIIQIISGATFYILSSSFLKLETYKYLIGMLRNKNFQNKKRKDMVV